MNSIELLQQALKSQLPQADLELDRPEDSKTPWFLDAQLGEHKVIVEWRPRRGFGLGSPNDDYGSGPDEVYEDLGETLARVVHLLKTGERTQEPTYPLKQLREGRGVTQAVVARSMGIQQPSVSKIEKQDDWELSTLQRFVEAIGGVLEVRAKFPGDEVQEIPTTKHLVGRSPSPV